MSTNISGWMPHQTLSHKIPTFNDLQKEVFLKTLWENSPAAKGSNVDLRYTENVLCDIGR